VTKTLKHESSSVCEPSLLAVINNDCVRLSDVKLFCNHSKVILWRHHEWKWWLEVSD
jgi:hypothetical protein